jgi:cytoskeletal protein RodZ
MTTNHTPAQPNPAVPAKPRKPLRKRWSVRTLAALVVLIAGMAALGSMGSSHVATPKAAPAHSAPARPAAQPAKHAAKAPAAPATTAPAAPATTAPAAPATTAPAAPATTAPAAPATTAPAAPTGPTASQQQALDAAQGYLSDGQGFSRAGLIQQLTSQYGNGFSQADATWAVDNSGANWNDQAAIAAKGYASDGQGFSRQGLIDQLTSPYGGQFTYAQAVYGVDQAGL